MLHRSRSYRRHSDDICWAILRCFGLVVINTGRRHSARYSVNDLHVFLPVEFSRRCPLASSKYCEKTAEAIQMQFDVVGLVGPRNRVLGVKISAIWQIRSNDCVRRIWVDLTPGVATRPVPKLFWAILFYHCPRHEANFIVRLFMHSVRGMDLSCYLHIQF